MDLNDYQRVARTTAIYPEDAKITYPILGLAGEAGELCNKWKKTIRDGRKIPKHEMVGELGDILWYLSNVASDLGIDLNNIAVANVAKLQDRKERGVLGGSGDNR